jgi:NAD-dependent SIR2 family protein deacetylase
MLTLELSKVDTSSTGPSDLRDTAMAVIQSQRVVVITGAGISCSSGIPVSRSGHDEAYWKLTYWRIFALQAGYTAPHQKVLQEAQMGGICLTLQF